MKKVMLVFGTRPEAIKMCPLVNELKTRKNIETIVLVTGQHRQMLDQVLDAFSVQPDYDLSVMKDKQTLFDITTNILNGIKEVLDKEKPDVVLVHGDTTTTFAAALGCFYEKIPVGHVEAGLRTYDMRSPFPEEFNRRAAALLAGYHFAPTQAAAENLRREGIPSDRIFVTGNTGIDALRYTVKKEYTSPLLEWAGDGKLVLLTTHRRENIGEQMKEMLTAVKRAVEERKKARVLIPVHPNPQVKRVVEAVFDGCPNVRLCQPLGVVDFHNLMARAHLILTDSGGIQEEAAALCVPTLVLRDKTERPEGVASGVLRLSGLSPDGVYRGVCELYDSPLLRASVKNAANPYGDGYASARIAEILEKQI